MNYCRQYGSAPFRIVVVHGGPGAAGDMAPVARQLSLTRGVLEPLQTMVTLDGQVDELRRTLLEHAEIPATLIGHSWGAWLIVILAARFPELVKKLVLVGSGPFEEKYVADIAINRLKRLTADKGTEYSRIIDLLQKHDPAAGKLVPRLGELAAKADSYELSADDAVPEPMVLPVTMDRVYQGVWPAAAALRASGELMALAAKITCPVVALHGDSDPHPAAGVLDPLARVVKDFRMVILERCGHTPWRERHAADEFYALLERETSLNH